MTKSILVVDDDASIRDCLADIFESRGFHVDQTGSGESALELISGTPPTSLPSLLVIDQRMPGMGGVEFLRELRQRHPELFQRVSLLLFSASNDFLEQVGLEQDPRVHFLSKPVELEDLVQKVDELLASSHIQ